MIRPQHRLSAVLTLCTLATASLLSSSATAQTVNCPRAWTGCASCAYSQFTVVYEIGATQPSYRFVSGSQQQCWEKAGSPYPSADIQVFTPYGFANVTCTATTPLPSAAPPSVDLSLLSPACRVNPCDRVNAGWQGVSKSACEDQLGACWDNRTTDTLVPWCFEPLGKQPSCGPVEPQARVNAGWPGVSPETCVRELGACWDNRFPGVPWCFEQVGRQTTCDPSNPQSRVNAGWPGISAQTCVRDLGACWDDKVRGVPWCYSKRPR
jgi:hypothetical protein